MNSTVPLALIEARLGLSICAVANRKQWGIRNEGPGMHYSAVLNIVLDTADLPREMPDADARWAGFSGAIGSVSPWR